MTKSILLLCLKLISFVALSQSSHINGIIVDYETKEPLANATIHVRSKSIGTFSDHLGRFVLDVSNADAEDSILVSYVGYSSVSITLAAIRKQTELNIALKKKATVLNEVVVFSKFWLKQYTPAQLKEDYLKFCTLMEEVHTGLYEYITETGWRAMKDSCLQVIRQPMTHSEFYRLIALQVASVRNAHTKHGVTDSWYRMKQKIFPFNVRYLNDKLYIDESLVPELNYPRGTEILEINGRDPLTIRSMIWSFIPADGYIQTGKAARLNDYFPWFYSLFVEEAEYYRLKLRTRSGDEVVVNSQGFISSFAKLSWSHVTKRRKTALELQLYPELNAAYFRIEDSRVFKDSLKPYFNRIRDNHIKSLVIDLRGDGGMREEEQVAELYSYLVNKSFTYIDRIEVKSNDPNVFDKDFSFRPYANSRKHIKENFYDKLVDSGKGYYLWKEESYVGVIQPADIYYSGDIYILVDGRNYSASTDFTSIAAQLDNVKIVGEETGGEYRTYVSGAMHGLVLPNSKIGIKIPNWKSVLAVKEYPDLRGRGVIPDFIVEQSFDDFVNDRDRVRELAFQIIRERK